MRVFTVNDHDGPWPWASVVVAESGSQAQLMLDRDLRRRGLKPYSEQPYAVVELPLDGPSVRVLADGDF